METLQQTTEKELFIKMVVSNWDIQNTRINKFLAGISDEQLLSETAPGRNSGAYLIGHLTAVSDAMLPLFGWGDKLYPQLETIFVKNGDKAGLEKPSLTELKKYWNDVNEKVTQHIHAMQPEDWFTRHAAVSAEDFAKEPFRNKLNVLINRTAHHSYHLGQLVYLIKK